MFFSSVASIKKRETQRKSQLNIPKPPSFAVCLLAFSDEYSAMVSLNNLWAVFKAAFHGPVAIWTWKSLFSMANFCSLLSVLSSIYSQITEAVGRFLLMFSSASLKLLGNENSSAFKFSKTSSWTDGSFDRSSASPCKARSLCSGTKYSMIEFSFDLETKRWLNKFPKTQGKAFLCQTHLEFWDDTIRGAWKLNRNPTWRTARSLMQKRWRAQILSIWWRKSLVHVFMRINTGRSNVSRFQVSYVVFNTE